MFKEYLEAYSIKIQSQSSTSSLPQSQSTQAGGASSSDLVDDIRAELEHYMQGKKTAEPVKTEHEEYLGEPLDNTGLDAEFVIFAWWKLKVPKYPVLSRLVPDILDVLASTVASESTFSTSGRTLSPVRKCLNDESIWKLSSVLKTGCVLVWPWMVGTLVLQCGGECPNGIR
ncbi:Zinc finger BED domain-containing protein DAYSLEEPER [Rhynchospora pubera]|uniref:Zinc finger BED domain-containing protein DAYSLEEPER n=1 Tax=Rhynchospora pubera TaxID=906938 RepID=A0AAV8DYW7_9POAL|nr:Zinc finger BED domain-containing protein DAYSLEEPER [Rhynchospora pubera]